MRFTSKLAISLLGLLLASHSSHATVHRVKPGQTIDTIAAHYRVTPKALADHNRLSRPDRLQIGQTLNIPPTGAVAAPISMRNKGFAKVDRLSVRVAPSRTARMLTAVDKGQYMLVTAVKSGWAQVKLPSGKMGWVSREYISVTGPAPAPVVAPVQQVKRQPSSSVRTASAPVKPAASRNAPKQTAKPQQTASVNRSAYTRTSPDGRVMQIASRHLGTRYRSGGSSPNGFDCSGFTRYVMKSAEGVSLPHSARAQFSKGVPVSKSELKKGDLVFFACNGRGISHVGIYEGNGRFIHANRPGGSVRYERLDTGYYQRTYVGARRLSR